MRHIWLNPKSCKLNWLRKEISQKLTNRYKQNWQNQVNDRNSCTLYRTFKNQLSQERYLLLPDCADKINIAKFRCRISKIPVVILGHVHRNIDYENRICPLCNMGEIGDEFQYILQSPTFHSHRGISNIAISDPNREKFTQLFQNENFSTYKST